MMFELKPSKPSQAIGDVYHSKISKLDKEMMIDVYKKVVKEYKQHSARITSIAQDSDPVGGVNSLLKSLLKYWLKKYTDQGTLFVIKFVNDVDTHNKTVVSSAIKEYKNSFKLEMTKETLDMRTAKKSLIQGNIDLIKSIPQKHMDRVSNILFEGISRGTDVTEIQKSLQQIEGVTKRRAKLITRDQLSKATSVINNARYLENGFTDAIWKHSPASKEPRPDHVKANGTKYKISDGCKISGEYIQPGQLINCKCYSTVVVQ